MIIIVVISFAVIIAYIFLLLYISSGWDDLEDPDISDDFTPANGATIIIPARNEKNNIARCIDSIHSGSIDKQFYEIIVVDDHSTDGTGDFVSGNYPEVRVVSPLAAKGKKAALTEGVIQARYDLCIVTDADSAVGPHWLAAHMNCYEKKNTSFQAGPVICTFNNDMLSAFQLFDFAGMSQVIANGIQRKRYYIANGANMAFSKKAFQRSGGMNTHSHIASGDDMILVNNISLIDPDLVTCLKDPGCLVVTQSEMSWKDLWLQRKRWASKTRSLPNSGIFYIQVFIFMVCALIAGHFLIIPWTGGASFFTGVFLLAIKAGMDYLFLSKSLSYYRMNIQVKYFFSSFLIYFFYIFLMAWYAIKGGSYEWKGRITK